MLHQAFDTIRKFTRDLRGVSAVEFALVAPLLFATLLGLADTANFAVASTSMERAVRAGAQYIMKDGSFWGTANNVASTIVSQSWREKPSDGTISVSTACSCLGESVSCNSGTVCVDGSLPLAQTTITARATVAGILVSRAKAITETVRVQ